MKKKKKDISNFVLVGILLAGMALLTYPSISNWWNQRVATTAVAQYNKTVVKTDRSEIEKMWRYAERYNRVLAEGSLGGEMSKKQKSVYEKALNVSGNGVMGYIEIPMQNISLPIYHGTADTVLMVGVGHVDWSHLPVGGEGTHTVLSGHRGLPSAKLFTDIDQMVVGDLFYLDILDKQLTYEVDQIQIVLPQELNSLRVEPGQDLCTLVTCTPYGVNSHRLLVRGHRVDTPNNPLSIRVTADALQIRPAMVAPFIAAPILVVLIILLFIDSGRKRDDDDDWML